MRPLLILLVLPLVTGCIGSRAYQPATSLGAGRFAADATADATPLQTYSGLTLVPSGSLGVTWGISERVDARVAVGTEGITAETKLVAFQNRTQGWSLSAAPNVSGGFWLFGGGYSVEAPVLLGYRPDPQTEIVLGAGPKYADILIDAWAGSNRFREFSGVAALSLHRFAGDGFRFFAGGHVRVPLLKFEREDMRPVMGGASVGVAYHFN